MAHPLVADCKRAPYDVYIGRPSQWGNPFQIGRDGTRARVIARYERWLEEQPELLAALPQLAGKTLGCWCAPQRATASCSLVWRRSRPGLLAGACGPSARRAYRCRGGG